MEAIAAQFLDLGRVEYQAAWDLQRALQERQIAGTLGPLLLFVEHPPTITIGRRGTAEEVVAPAKVLASRGVKVIETDRGGQVTYHGPGQLVAYPLIPLDRLGFGLHEYMRALEEAVIRYLEPLGLKGYRVADRTGVWVGKEKICAMGIRVRRWWTIHGLALNVTTDLNHFGLIVPCGIRDRGVTSLQKLLGVDCPDSQEVRKGLRESLGRELHLQLRDATWSELGLSPAAAARATE